jgi:ElaB/YqjD/DUF883 family membrane-anchored ribosome-binding protein
MSTDTTATPTPTNSNVTKERVAETLRQMVDEANDLLKQAAAAGDEKFDATRVRLERQLGELRLQLEDLQDTIALRARRAARVADHTVHTHPYSAMGIAGAAGLLIGLLVARR